MPYGLILSCLGVAVGGALGSALRRWIGADVREKLPMICGMTAICSGILSVIRADQMPVVMLAVVLGGWLGVALHLERRVRSGFGLVLRRLALPDSFDMEIHHAGGSVLLQRLRAVRRDAGELCG